MLPSKRAAAIALALVMFTLVVGARYGVTQSLDFGERDTVRFAGFAYGFDIPADTHPFFLTWSRGDGQAFMSIAADLNGDGVSTGLGYQSYRMSRIGLSILGRVVALGSVDLLPYGLAGASLLSYAALLAVAVRLTDPLGMRSLVLGLSPAAIIATVFDTAEGLGSLLLVIALTSSATWIAVAAGALLGVTRPSYGTAVVAARRGVAVPAATILAGVTLQAIVTMVLSVPFSGSGNNIVFPLTGFFRAFPTMHPITQASALVVLLMAATLFQQALSKSFQPRYRIAAAASALLAISVSPATFVGPLSPMRVSGALVVLLVLSPLFNNESAETNVQPAVVRPDDARTSP